MRPHPPWFILTKVRGPNLIKDFGLWGHIQTPFAVMWSFDIYFTFSEKDVYLKSNQKIQKAGTDIMQVNHCQYEPLLSLRLFSSKFCKLHSTLEILFPVFGTSSGSFETLALEQIFETECINHLDLS